MPDADLASTLAGIRERYERGAKITATGRDVCASADDVPALLAAVEAALEKADGWEGPRAERLVTRRYAAECFRAAITAALGGTQQSEDRDRA